MSIAGLRSYEYQRATDLDAKLKRLIEEVRNDARAQTQAARQARLQLALELNVIAEFLDPLSEDATIHAREALRLPVPVLRRLRGSQVNGRPARGALATTIAHLRDHSATLDQADLDLFDVILSATSHEASDAFDRVVRR
jgi:hypothetical protein